MSERAFIERWLLPSTDLLARYHRFEARGLENVPAQGPLLIVVSHSALTYDFLLGMAAIYRERNRVVHPLAHRLWLQIPGVRAFMANIGVVLAGHEKARELLARGEIVGVAPGGLWEALRPSEERFRLRWAGRRGFARLALAAETPIMVACCPAADLALTVYRSGVTDEVYRRHQLPLPFMRGLGPTLIPRPVKLTAYFSEVLPFVRARSVDELAELVEARLRRLIDDAVRAEGLELESLR
jgi:1-acyl-sn-glycerol-3-phosphate acyltransferase